MAAAVKHVDGGSLKETIDKCRILIVGAGGIGCELIKNLVLAGFVDLDVIDLDTIDVSNLNRQFLFRKEHVGLSKAKVARDSALFFNPDAKIVANHDSIMNPKYDVNYFKSFTMVLNALDNRAARNHVNRMCLAANTPLVESGTAGYLGQVQVILKGKSECYECQPKPTQKQYPGCTIRNTPSEPIHCIVWAKHLFNQLFGEADDDEDVSPDTADPELAADAGQSALNTEAVADAVGGIERVSTRQWAVENKYDAEKLFNKLFRDDIKYLLSMETLWTKRRPPVPLNWNSLPDEPMTTTSSNTSQIKDQRLWSVEECADMFRQSVGQLRDQLIKQGDDGLLVWDKDEPASMDFVCSVANIRSHIFGIQCKTRFDVKSMAGNIIPAIATTNAIIAGLIVVEAIKVLRHKTDQCKMIYLSRKPNPRNKLIIPCALQPPNPKCYVCQPKPEVTVRLNTQTFIVKQLEDKILKQELGMVAPDVEIDDGKGTIIISSEEGETEALSGKLLSDLGIKDGVRLKCDDFLQEYNLVINIAHVEALETETEKEFELIRGDEKLGPKPTTESEEVTNGDPKPSSSKDGEGDSTKHTIKDDDDDDCCMIVDEDDVTTSSTNNDVIKVTSQAQKRKASQELGEDIKKQKVSHDDDDDDIICLG